MRLDHGFRIRSLLVDQRHQFFGADYPLLKSMSYPEADLPFQFEQMHVK